MTTATNSPEQQETVFPDQVFFDVFLEEVEGQGLKPEDTVRILEDLTKDYGQGLPKKSQFRKNS